MPECASTSNASIIFSHMHPMTSHKIRYFIFCVSDAAQGYIQLLFRAFAAWLTWSSMNVEMKKYE